MLTLFCVPKRFAGHDAVIQQNALESWARLGSSVELLLLGSAAGVAEEAARVGARHEPDIETSEQGTPLVSSAFEVARNVASSRLLAYVNADIVLLPDFVDTVGRIHHPSFLAVGRRWNSDISSPLDFGPRWDTRLRAVVRATGRLAEPDAIDYFVFEREGEMSTLPPFVVGRPGWDNWMIFRARSLGVPVIDTTRAITAIHQAHGYEHIPEGTGLWYGPEAAANFALIEGLERFQTRHATHTMTRFGPVPALGPRRLASRVRSRHVVNGRVERLARAAEKLLPRRLSGRGRRIEERL
jgi:hypothetical protein